MAWEVVWRKKNHYGYGDSNEDNDIDDQSCMTIAKNPKFHAHTKHIKIEYHYVLELVDNEIV